MTREPCYTVGHHNLKVSVADMSAKRGKPSGAAGCTSPRSNEEAEFLMLSARAKIAEVRKRYPHRTDEPECEEELAREADSDIGAFAITPEWLFDSGVPMGAVVLFGVLACYADNKTKTCWPSRTTLASRLKVSADTIDRWKNELVALNVLKIKSTSREDGGQTYNGYAITYAKPQKAK